MSLLILYTIFYLIASIGIFIIAALVFLRGRTRTYRLFAWFSVLLGGWLLLQFLAQLFGAMSASISQMLLELAIASSAFFTVLFYSFTQAYRDHTVHVVWHIVAPTLFGVLVLVMPDLVMTNVTINEQGIGLTPTPVYYGQLVFIAAYALLAIRNLFTGARSSNKDTRYRSRLLLFAVFQALVIILFATVLLADQPASQLALPVACLAMMVLFAYAIIKHRLFDIRLIVVRALGYVFSVATLAAVYSIVAFGIVVRIFSFSDIALVEQAVFVGLALVLALTFAPLKGFFDKLTRLIFYREAYVPQEIIDKLSTLIVHTVDLQRLARTASHILKDAIRAEYVGIILAADGERKREIVAGKRSGGMVELGEVMLKQQASSLLQDELDPKTDLHGVMQSADCAAAVRLQTHNQFIGYIVLGFKSNGTPYTLQDIDLIRIVAEELAIAVQNALRFEEISRFNQTLRQEITDATAQLRDSNRKLKKLDEAKDEFISMASHQLRTPLTSVKGYISMALEGDAGPVSPAQRKLLEEAFMSSQRMVYLIGDFLNVSRLQTGKFVLEPKPVNLAALTKDEINQLLTTAQRRNITLEYHQPTHFPVLQLDDNKMRQVIMNFIDNAIFYSKPDSKVLIALVATNKDVRLTVHDTGIGVPERERHHLFTKFYRAENARRARPDGTGIGLFMAKKVITAHGGSIIFESRENRGSTFGFSLPLSLEKQVDQLEQDKNHN